jgi:hypothetical protein
MPNYIIRIGNKFQKYPILAINDYSKTRKNRFSIILRDPNSLYPENGSILLLCEEGVEAPPSYLKVNSETHE